MNLANLWKNEYDKKGIPSSFKDEPTKGVLEFINYLESISFKGNKAIDLGCGRGRNSYFLEKNGYEVTSIDFVENNVLEINKKAREQNLKVKAYCQSVTDPWPIVSPVDIAIDVFCYKHIVDKVLQKKYRENLKVFLKKGGYYFLSLALDEDGFYGPLLVHSKDPQNKRITDPFCLIDSFLYSQEEIIAEFSDTLKIVKALKVTSKSLMHGKEYERKVLYPFKFKNRIWIKSKPRDQTIKNASIL